MAINPFRIGQLEIPANPQQRPIDWSPIAQGLSELGAGLGRYREQQQLGEIMAGAVDPATGELDLAKAAKVLAASGRDPRTYIDAALRQQGLSQTERHQSEVLAAAERRHQEDIALRRQQIEEGKSQTGVIPNELGIGPPTIYRTGPGKTYDILTPAGAPPGPAPAPAPGPRSEAPAMAPAAPNFADRFGGGPETGAPYQVAALGGGAPAAPAAAAPGIQTAQAAPTVAESPAWQQVPPAARETLKAILAHQQPVPSAAWLNLARSVDPNFDPSQYEVKKREALRPERQLSRKDIEDLTAEGGKAKNAVKFSETFKDSYSGLLATGGELGIKGAHYFPETSQLVNPDLPKAATWWQGYESFKNEVRKGIFGATLTASEQAAFDRSNVTPGMSPTQIKRYLGEQRLIVTGALARQANALISEGYNPETLQHALGMDLKKDLGVTVEGRSRGALKGSAAPKPVTSDADVNKARERALRAMEKGLSEDEAVKIMEDMKIPNARRILLGK